MFNPTTSPNTGSAISSQGLQAGPLQLDWLDGLTTENSGPDRAHVSHGPEQDDQRAHPATNTSGLFGDDSLQQESLLSSWESKFRQRLAEAGGTKWPQTWKQMVTPHGRQLPRLVVSAPAIRESDSGLFPTPLASETGWRRGKFPQGGTSLSTALGGPPNPAWVAWLMGFRPEWDGCAPLEMPSTRASRPK